MARIVQHRIVCDLGDDQTAHSVTLTVNRRTVTVDLCDEHRDELDRTLGPYLAAGRGPASLVRARGGRR